MKYKNFEDFIQMKHADQYEGLKDGMIDDLQRWYEDLDIDDWINYADEFANIGKLTEEELQHCDRMLQEDWAKEYNYAGGFQTKLMRAIENADEHNLKKLETIYPTLVNTFRLYSGQTVEAIAEAKASLKEKGINL